jgi:hypothetical protein
MTAFKSNRNPMFRSKFSEDIFNLKYSHAGWMSAVIFVTVKRT